MVPRLQCGFVVVEKAGKKAGKKAGSKAGRTAGQADHIFGTLRIVAALAIGCMADISTAEIFVWVDADGLTHISDDPSAVPGGAKTGPEYLRGL